MIKSLSLWRATFQSRDEDMNIQSESCDYAQDDGKKENISETRRDFIKKYGALAAVTPVALTLTMHGQKALASSCTECGP